MAVANPIVVNTLPPCRPCPCPCPCPCPQQIIVSTTPSSPKREGMLSKIFKRGDGAQVKTVVQGPCSTCEPPLPASALVSETNPKPPASTPMPVAQPIVVKTAPAVQVPSTVALASTTPPPADWRQSWGQVAGPKTEGTTTVQTPPSATTPLPVNATTTATTTQTPSRAATYGMLPSAAVMAPAPKAEVPAWVVKVATPDPVKPPRSSVPVSTAPAAVATLPTSPTPAVTAPRNDVPVATTPAAVATLPTSPTPAVTPPRSDAPVATAPAAVAALPTLPIPVATPPRNDVPVATTPAAVATLPTPVTPSVEEKQSDPIKDVDTYLKQRVPGAVLPKQPNSTEKVANAGGPSPEINPATGLPTKLPTSDVLDTKLVVPVGRHSVVAANQAAADESALVAKLQAAAKAGAPLPAVSLPANEGNAFGDAPRPQELSDEQRNAFTGTAAQPPSPLLPVQYMVPNGAPPMGVPMLPPGQGMPMGPPMGQPMMGPPPMGQPMMPPPMGQPPMMMAQPMGGQPGMVAQPIPLMPRGPMPGQPVLGQRVMPPAIPMGGRPPMYMQQPSPVMAPPDQYIPSGYRNAFTVADIPRPIPADMGKDYNRGNAFEAVSGTIQTDPPMGVPPQAMNCGPPPGWQGQGGMPMMQQPMVAMVPPGFPPGPMQPAMGPRPMMLPNPDMLPVHNNGPVPGAAQAPPAPGEQNGVQQVSARSMASALPEGAGVQDLLMILSDCMYPSQREWAAERLSRFDWHGQPQVLEGVLHAAGQDPAPAVRAACIRSLVRMKAGNGFVIQALTQLCGDKDQRVRQEAEQALTVLGPGQATAGKK
jgi:HEAT repeats